MFWRLFGFVDKNGDLQAMQDLVSHANGLAETDVARVTEAMEAARQARKALDKEMLPVRDSLEPACRAFVDLQDRLLVGKDGLPSLVDRVEKAQGDIRTMLWLGHKPYGCIDACSQAGVDSPMGTCSPGNCHSILRSTRQLEEVLAGPLWRQRQADAKLACGRGEYALRIEPPIGLEDAAGAGAGGDAAGEGAGDAAAVKEQALPALLAVGARPLLRSARARRGRATRARPRTGTRARAFL
mmetsp:Transcript_56241/g.174840  ORF Transcript_56241/g.174840 Transcript_56241/m.174840 type:complete len:241 (+) Transcript_56241:74-796(+)